MAIYINGKKVAGVGMPGKDGKSAYQLAVEGGYQGTEEGFSQILANGGLPSGGTPGQMLYQGESGPEWGDKPVMYVNITGSEGNFQADKTLEEIGNAYSSGAIVYAIKDSVVIPLYQCQPSIIAIFYLHSADKEFSFFIDNSGVSGGSSDFKASYVAFTPGTTGLTSNNVQDAIEEVQGNIPTDYVSYKSGTAVANCNAWLTNGYTKTNPETTNLPAQCTGNDRWGILFFIAENAKNGTGTQMYFPIDGNYKGRLFIRSLTNMTHEDGTAVGEWMLLSIDGESDITYAPLRKTVTLSASAWSSNQQTVSVSGIFADEAKQLIQPVPSSDGRSAYNTAGIECVSQAENSLTFACEEVPSEDLTVYVVITLLIDGDE